MYTKKAEAEPTHSQKTKAIKKCSEWLVYCLEIGYDKSALDELQKLWWQHHNEDGTLKKN
jgi:hypothetical protein